MTRILLADDHAIVRRGLKLILQEDMDDIQFEEAGDAATVLKKMAHEAFDILILDIGLPGKTGIDVLKEVKLAYPRTRILIVTMHPEDQYALRVMRAGADGYMTKDSAPDELIGAVKRIMDGRKYVSAALAEQMLFDMNTPRNAARHQTLSDREFDILQRLGQGITVAEIADSLAISPKTVSSYRRRVLDKMNMTNNAELMRYTIEQGLAQ